LIDKQVNKLNFNFNKSISSLKLFNPTFFSPPYILFCKIYGNSLAAIFASLMDSGKLRMEGLCVGERKMFDMPIELSLICPTIYSEEVKAYLSRYHIVNPNEKANKAREGEMRERMRVNEAWAAMLREGNAMAPERRNEFMDQLGADVKELAKIQEADQPIGLKTKLLKYQRQGVYWLNHAENPPLPTKNIPIQFWSQMQTRQGLIYVNSITGTGTVEPPELMRGGILADDMGLGKTIQILGLILSVKNTMSIPGSISSHKKLPTLIVCPLSVLGGWEEQIQSKFIVIIFFFFSSSSSFFVIFMLDAIFYWF